MVGIGFTLLLWRLPFNLKLFMKYLPVCPPFLLCALAVVLFTTSCTKDPEPEAPVLKAQYVENVAYGDDARHRMDVYLPEGRDEKTPVVVLLHGGFWTSGGKSDFTAIQQQLSANGIASVNMNYRYVSPTNNYTGLMADVGAALALVKSKASEWGIRSGGYHLAGASAGGYMALLYGYTAKKPDEVRSVVSIAGPVGFSSDLLSGGAATAELLQTVERLVGAPIPTDPMDLNALKYLQASPISHVSSAVPTLIIHGTADELVPFAMAQGMKTALDGANVSNQLVPLEGGKHDFSTNPLHVLAALNALSTWITAQETH